MDYNPGSITDQGWGQWLRKQYFQRFGGGMTGSSQNAARDLNQLFNTGNLGMVASTVNGQNVYNENKDISGGFGNIDTLKEQYKNENPNWASGASATYATENPAGGSWSASSFNPFKNRFKGA